MNELTNEEFNEKLTVFLATIDSLTSNKRINMKEYNESKRKARNDIELYMQDKVNSVDGYYDGLMDSV